MVEFKLSKRKTFDCEGCNKRVKRGLFSAINHYNNCEKYQLLQAKLASEKSKDTLHFPILYIGTSNIDLFNNTINEMLKDRSEKYVINVKKEENKEES